MAEPDRRAGDPGNSGDSASSERAPLGILFLAAAVALAVILIVVGLVASAALAPRLPGRSDGDGALAARRALPLANSDVDR